ncbi:crossover junction endodeoxyribonuclease RuvC [Candidatus Collierbacteria bacterium RIFOXYB2_FULL_46_14]|uniref:Crossover junction endodeoxyribonuclease RuvC n=1 Tax=Candidatus Collierbacteria bacterium GW2011_GWA2_46_26 TaxID=1618381 RepID=A0A0G1PIR3_9BACT|nr:MAG: Crossover junction endodeoxyribonuclease RuvC [Candidatus Collierbacteria bacterium GW2011_GWC2_44_13]KKU32689.1 MAG: Crossover junction endodeoxyribonuclease RuvC [Candidatus Collierbacteria bacterium GW2011_GWA2_46_26]OGD73235.1 MAG: crossover junction endodeoxyribonuclease RuvC [Candidatus Collierbacteria bacterium RIFOXYB2_FULL_46_14]OGD76277.1 MAG: crossover junction endodeoxyribonuclease RuvC [Candidatus Collierbacteria bacterium RIFOXYA2_FULL_46_20]OGD77613.1 MAG: crossover junct
MKILGIDPGTGRVGWGIISHDKGVDTFVDCGCFETKANSDLPDRLVKIYEYIEKLIQTHNPDVMAVESLFFEKNAKTAIDVAAARGVTLLAGAKARLTVFQYTPLQVKSSLTGYGKAEKNQVEFMVGKILHLKEKIKPDDAADAVAIALTHAFRVR